ncbi:hypothetical protein [Staphylococcus xylosus]
MTNKFQYDKKKRVASGDYYGGDIMNNDYISRPEFELHQRHMDSRFDAIDEKLDLTKESISSEIKNAISELKVEINKDKVTESKFRTGIAIPSIISVVSIIVTVLIAFFS